MNSKKLQDYVAPEVKIVEVEVEQGFAVSNEGMGYRYGDQEW